MLWLGVEGSAPAGDEGLDFVDGCMISSAPAPEEEVEETRAGSLANWRRAGCVLKRAQSAMTELRVTPGRIVPSSGGVTTS